VRAKRLARRGGCIAKKLLRERFGVEVLAYVKQVRDIVARVDPERVKFKEIESNIVRCPDSATANQMIQLIEKMRKAGEASAESWKAWRAACRRVGRPVFDRLEADLRSDAELAGLEGYERWLRLRRHPHDRARAQRSVSHGQGRVGTTSNRSRWNSGRHFYGETIYFRVAFKQWPRSCTAGKTVNVELKNTR